jgi:hypothetical protein
MSLQIASNYNYAICTPNIYKLISAQPDLASLISTISTLLQLTGWQLAMTLPTGVRLLGASPQGYSVYLELTQQTTGISSVPNAVGWQLKSAVGTGAVGTLAYSQFDTLSTYQIVSFPCGWFFSRPFQDADAVCGGIPYDPYSALIGPPPSPPGDCNLGTLVSSEIWWMMAQSGSAGVSVANPRSTLDRNYGNTTGGTNFTQQNCGCQSGTVRVGTGNIGDPQILRLSSTIQEGSGTPQIICPPIWFSGQDYIYPSFISWGDAAGLPIKVRGQAYNCINRTGSYPSDMQRSWDLYQWINYTDLYYFGSLWVLLSGGQVGNTAWQSA